VQGAARGGGEILTLRLDTARVRAAIGHSRGLSPQKLTDDQLSAVYDEFDEDNSGELSKKELANAITKLGVRQGHTLVHFSAQPEPFLTQTTP
jgi:hypothetical protein